MFHRLKLGILKTFRRTVLAIFRLPSSVACLVVLLLNISVTHFGFNRWIRTLDEQQPFHCNPYAYRLSDTLRRLWPDVCKHSVFQPVGGNGTQSYVYSAYIDDRVGMKDVEASADNPVVRLFALVDRSKHRENIKAGKWECLFWNSNFKLIYNSPVIVWTELNEFEAWRRDRIPPVMLSCRLPVLNCPATVGHCAVGVSLVTERAEQPSNLVQLVDLPTARKTGARLDNPRPFVEFAICPKTLYAGATTSSIEDFVEFIEVNRMFGAEEFHFYIEENSVDEKMRRCIAKYERLGVVHTIPWSVPNDISSMVPWHGQFLTMTECVYRMMYRTKYLIHQDLDEFIVPRRADHWRSMIALVDFDASADHNGTSGDQWIASYSVISRFFPLDWPDTLSELPSDIQKQANQLTAGKALRFRTLSWTRADQRTYKRIMRSKVIGRPERTVQWYVHMVLDKHVVPSFKNRLLDESDALLHHYRQRVPGLKIEEPSTYRCSRLSSYAPKIIERLRKGLEMCRSALEE